MASANNSGHCSVIVGCQWGDEGKGKIVDVLAEQADIVARYQGGANAGHTVHVGEREFILHQIPSGVLHDNKRCLLGNGVVLDLLQFFQEFDALVEKGIDVAGRVGISERAHLLMPYHRVLDKAKEDKAAEKIGTTGRGIGPAYEEKAGRRGIRVADIHNVKRFEQLVNDGVARARTRLQDMGLEDDGSLDRAMDETLALRDRLAGVATDTGLEIVRALDAGQNVLLEGAQGTALDLDHGTYPFVTSSNTTAAGAATGVGIGPTRITDAFGVVKAYTTRVGNGPLPTGNDAAVDEQLRQLGGEFGATTGRPRRCGWFDVVLARYAARVNGLTGLAVTKLDVLDTLPEIKLGMEYCFPDGHCALEFPADTYSLSAAEPNFETMPGWEADTTGCRTLEDLPRNARAYLDRIQELTETPIRFVSVGTRRDQIIFVD